MNKYIKMFPALMLMGTVVATSCSSEWDDHFENTQTPISNSQLEIINKKSMDYLAEREDLSSMYEFLKENKVDSILNAKLLMIQKAAT